MFENLFHGITSFFERGYNFVSEKAHDAYEYIVSGTKTILETPKNVVQTVYSDAKDLIIGIGGKVDKAFDRGAHTIDNIVNNAGDVIKHGQSEIGDAAKGLGESFASPLTILAAGAAFFYLFVKK